MPTEIKTQTAGQAVNAANDQSKGDHNAHVSVKEIENIKEEKLQYLVIRTPKGKHAINVGEKTLKAIQALLEA